MKALVMIALWYCMINSGAFFNYKLDFYTSYNQFYVFDRGSEGNTDSPNFWSKDAFHERLAVERGILGVGIGSYGHVKAQLEVLSKPKSDVDFNQYDHIVEAGINVRSGVLQILDCPNSKIELSIKVRPGNYCVRVYSSNLSKAGNDENEGGDYYKIEIWPDDNLNRKVLKQY